jgi:hypothetical protein
MLTFIKYLNEMPLPKNMAPDALTPDAGKYSSEKAENALNKTSVKLGEGSSRVAFRVGVEPSQFKQGTGDLDLIEGLADTVIKVALNSRGIAQNEEEIKVYKKFKKYKCLLPIIDTSKNHAISLSVQDPTGKKLKTTSNWIQMPYADQPASAEFNRIFESWFGQLSNAFKELYPEQKHISAYSYMLIDDRRYKLHKLVVGKYINEQHFQHIQELIHLQEAGLNLDDLINTENWGVYKGRPVILDYGFTTKSQGLYNHTKYAIASVEDDGSIKLIYSKHT